MRTVDVYFDFSSPFAYLGTTQIERVAAEAGGAVRFVPFLLGALFKEIGTPLVPIEAMSESKRRLQRLDLLRWADHYGVPFVFNTHFPLRSVAALRLALCADAAPALIHRIMRAAWVEDRDVADLDVLARCLSDAGLDASLLARIDAPEIKQALRETTDRARALGCPGAPCFVVEGELYWGQDRLHFVRAALEGRAPAKGRSPS